MVRPLEKRGRDSALYQRRGEVEEELQQLIGLEPTDLVARVRSGEARVSPRVSSEAILHLARREARSAQANEPVHPSLDALASILLRRVERILRRRLSGYDDVSREQITELVTDRLVDGLVQDGDKLDYAEVNFNDWLLRRRADAIRKHATAAAVIVRPETDVNDLLEQDAGLATAQSGRAHHATPEALYAIQEGIARVGLPDLLGHTNLSSDELSRLAEIVEKAGLPRDVLYAFAAHLLGVKVSSQNPNEHTLVKHFGKSEKTIRNWIAKAENAFAELRKKG